MLIDKYIKCMCLQKAQCVSEEMEGGLVVSGLTMITWLTAHEKGEEVLRLFPEMV